MRDEREVRNEIRLRSDMALWIPDFAGNDGQRIGGGGATIVYLVFLTRAVVGVDRPGAAPSQATQPACTAACHNSPKRTPELRHRRPDLHGRIIRRPPAPPRLALRRRRPLRAVAQPDRRSRPLRAADWTSGDIALAIAPTDALRPTPRHRRERGLSGMRHPRRAGGAAPARHVGGGAADALDRQPRGGRSGAEPDSGRAAGAAVSRAHFVLT